MNKLYKSFFSLVLTFLFLSSVSFAADDVLLGPGDILKVSVFEQPDLSLEVRVSDSGTITYPLIGAVHVGGGTPAEAEKKIANMLETGGYLKNPHVSIIVAQLQSLQASVLGQVGRPGRYPLDSARTLADVLALAGGIAPDGADIITIVQKVNDKTTRTTIDIADMMRSGNLDNNIEIKGGDIVYVERSPKFYIYGEVQRPGQYRLEHNMTVLQALSVGGGLTMRGTEKGVVLKRQNESGSIEVIKAKHDDLIQQNDVVYIKESFF
ncbi:polysaccharide export protein EpsE [Methylobacillus arboreus]|uniref:polysaccharide export protein EpsE n=1 Tax=Methylobacillus arboreus TaxID=755170 RepID=UPI001E3F254F|nr:polysaccharide export protein EpsE [Methylobacillus arboreus]MCB5189212.1 polysaccharide export protein EpsE [Methylobacillus arboreus]